MGKLFAILGSMCALLALFFNITNAIWLWGGVGGFLAVFAFPIMFIVVPISVILRGEIPIYWLLVPATGVFFWLAARSVHE